jgi:hypothetical protein
MVLRNSVPVTKKTCFHYKDHLVNTVREIITINSETDMKPINVLCGQNTELLMLMQNVHTVRSTVLRPLEIHTRGMAVPMRYRGDVHYQMD